VRRALAGHDDVIAEGQECVRLATPDDWPMGIGHVRRRSGGRALVARDGGCVRRDDPAKARWRVDASRHAAASRRPWASHEARDAPPLPQYDGVLLRGLPRVGVDSASLSSCPGVFAATRVASADQPAAAGDQRRHVGQTPLGRPEPDGGEFAGGVGTPPLLPGHDGPGRDTRMALRRLTAERDPPASRGLHPCRRGQPRIRGRGRLPS
jgi:hypothetical protein